MNARALIAAVLAFAACFAGAAPALAQDAAATGEYRVKAAFLYKFGGYVEWPAAAFTARDAPLTIGVAGADALAEELARVVPGHSIGGRSIEVRRLRSGDPLDGVHVLFIGRDHDDARFAELLAAADRQAMLTVTEVEDALQRGSMINFVIVDDKVRFDVALPPADQRRVRISSRLLAVARKVVVGPR